MAPLSPMMQQYTRIKQSHPDQILMFRLGDFYEMFFDDALLVSRELELTLTGRDCGQEERAPMCGVPYHSCESYIARLIKKGYKVAICDQMEDPKLAKGLVERQVTRVITPGTLIEENLLDEGCNNYIACLCLSEGEGLAGLAYADISTGALFVTQLSGELDGALMAELARIAPSELLFHEALVSHVQLGGFLRERLRCLAECLPPEDFEPEAMLAACREHFSDTASEQLFTNWPVGARALGRLLLYLVSTQPAGVGRLTPPQAVQASGYMRLSATTRRNLELTETLYGGEKRASLLWVLDKTSTAMGKRFLRAALGNPLINPILIEKRLNAVEELLRESITRSRLRAALQKIGDMERLITRVLYGKATPRELVGLRQSLERLPELIALTEKLSSALLSELRDRLDPMPDLCELLTRAIAEEPPLVQKNGGYIAKGYSTELDALRDLWENTRGHILAIETREREATGIKTLKIAFNKVFGYYIEVTRPYLSLVPADYIRKQTVANAERFITEELKGLEGRILSARESSITLEAELFEGVRQQLSQNLARIQQTAAAVAQLDFFLSLAHVAQENNYTRPTVTTGRELDIREGRHPVVELLPLESPFVSNDCLMDCGENQILLITGPNMAGKSTYIRQTALIVLMAQLGSFVPAASARIGVVDGIYTRVGASDDLAGGRSTFMVEMSELAEILREATGSSLLILDEIGRGTSTYDGMSIARATLEYIADRRKLGAKTLFATHYHELTALDALLPCCKNRSTAVKKRGDDITFLHKIVPGSVDDSYGIEVSKLAGIPDWIVRRAHAVLRGMEENAAAPAPKPPAKTEEENGQLLLSARTSPVEQALAALDPNTLTPLEALGKLYELKGILKTQ